MGKSKKIKEREREAHNKEKKLRAADQSNYDNWRKTLQPLPDLEVKDDDPVEEYDEQVWEYSVEQVAVSNGAGQTVRICAENGVVAATVVGSETLGKGARPETTEVHSGKCGISETMAGQTNKDVRSEVMAVIKYEVTTVSKRSSKNAVSEGPSKNAAACSQIMPRSKRNLKNARSQIMAVPSRKRKNAAIRKRSHSPSGLRLFGVLMLMMSLVIFSILPKIF